MGSATATTAESRTRVSIREALAAPQAARTGRRHDDLLRDVREGAPAAPPFGALDSFDDFWSAAFSLTPAADPPQQPNVVEGLVYAFDANEKRPDADEPPPEAPLPTEEEVDLSEYEVETDPDAPTPEHVRREREAAKEAERIRLEEERRLREAAEAEALRLQLEKEEEERRICEEKEAEERRIREEKEAEERRILEEKQAEERRIREEEERLRKQKEAEEQRIREEKEAEERRIQEEKEAEERRIREEKEAEELRIREKEAEERRLFEEAERKRLLEEEVARRVAEEKALYIKEQEMIRQREEAAKEAKRKKEELMVKVKAALEEQRVTPVRRNTEWTRAEPSKSILRKRNSIAPVLREEAPQPQPNGGEEKADENVPLVDYDSEDVTMHSRRDSLTSDVSKCESVVMHKSVSKMKRVSMSAGCQPELVSLVDYPKTPATKTPNAPGMRTRSRSSRRKARTDVDGTANTIRRRLADDLEECGVPGAKLERIRRASLKAAPPRMTEKGVSVRVSLDSPELLSTPRPRTKNMIDCGIMCRGEEIDAEIAIMFAPFELTVADGVNVPPVVRDDDKPEEPVVEEPDVEKPEVQEPVIEEPEVEEDVTPKLTFVEQSVSIQTPGKTVTHEVTNSILEDNPSSALKENERLLHVVGEGDAKMRLIEIKEDADSAKKSAASPMDTELVTPSPRASTAIDSANASVPAPRKSLRTPAQSETDSDFNTPVDTPNSAKATIGTANRVPIPSPPSPRADRRRPSTQLSSSSGASTRQGSKPFVTSAKPPKSPHAPSAPGALRTRRSLVFSQQATPEALPQEKTPTQNETPVFRPDVENIIPNMQSVNAEVRMASLDIPQSSATSTRRTRSMTSAGSAAPNRSPSKATPNAPTAASKQYSVVANVCGFHIPEKVVEDEVEEVLQTPPVRKRGRPRKNTKSLDFAINEKKRTVFKGRKSTAVGEEEPAAEVEETPAPRRSARNTKVSPEANSRTSRVESEKPSKKSKAARVEAEKDSGSKRISKADTDRDSSSKRITRSSAAIAENEERTSRGSGSKKIRGDSEKSDGSKRMTRAESAKASSSNGAPRVKTEKTEPIRRRSTHKSIGSSSKKSKSVANQEEDEVIVVSDEDDEKVDENDDALIPVDEELEVDEEKVEEANVGDDDSDGDDGDMIQVPEEEDEGEEEEALTPRRSTRSSTQNSTRAASSVAASKKSNAGSKKAATRGRKRGRPSKRDVQEVALEEEDRSVRRGKRARFPPLKFHLNEKVCYERRKSQQMPTIKSLNKVLSEDDVEAAPQPEAEAEVAAETSTPKGDPADDGEADFVPDDPLSPEDGGPEPEVEVAQAQVRVQNPRRSTRNAPAPAATSKVTRSTASVATTRSTRSRTRTAAATSKVAPEPARKRRKRTRK